MPDYLTPARLSGIWSATPTPLTNDRRLCIDDIPKLVDHHLALGIKGLFVAGTCGEGPWLRRGDLRQLTRAVVEHAAGRLLTAVQVTDNSALRILDNARDAAEDGADLAVIAPPHFLVNATPENVRALYLEAIRNSPLPVGIYDLGANGRTPVPPDVLVDIYAEPNVVLIKDSSCDDQRRDLALEARKKRPALRLLTGFEFDVVSYLEAGYDGALLGGAVFNGLLANQILAAVKRNDGNAARNLQERMNRLMWDVYGGREITCWLTGLKELLVRMGLFSTNRNFLDCPLTDTCRIAIARALEQERDVLFP
jgi:4-hydroxy-tetrahydrodipicolinate synthase